MNADKTTNTFPTTIDQTTMNCSGKTYWIELHTNANRTQNACQKLEYFFLYYTISSKPDWGCLKITPNEFTASYFTQCQQF